MEKVSGVLTNVNYNDIEMLKTNPTQFWKGVTKIGGGAFIGRTNLERINIPKGVTEIDDSAFSSCINLTRVTIPKTVSKIGKQAFFNCSSLQSFTIPNGVTTIEEGVFENCKELFHIDIPRSVTVIGKNAFACCSSLMHVTIPTELKVISENAFYYCSRLREANIPNSVVSIGSRAFCACENLEAVNIPESVNELGYAAFSNCYSLEIINIPGSLKHIGGNAFSDCSNLKSANISNGITQIPASMFYGCCNLEDITIPNGIKEIGSHAFAHCEKIKHINVPQSVTSIGAFAFSGCSLNELVIPHSVNTIDDNILYRCDGLLHVDIELRPGKVISVSTNRFNMLGNDFLNALREYKDLKGFNILCKNFNFDEERDAFRGFFKLCGILGLLENRDVTIDNEDGKAIPVANFAFDILQKALRRKNINYNSLGADLYGLKGIEFNNALLEFLNRRDRDCATELFKSIDKLPQINEWFKTRKDLIFKETIQLDGYIPTIEENRFKIWEYAECEDGMFREKWHAPTVEWILHDLEIKNHTKVLKGAEHISAILKKYGYGQECLDRAVDIDRERRIKIQSGKLKNSLISTQIKQSLEDAVEKYKQSTNQMEAEIASNLAECTSNLAEDRRYVFTYEMLDKSSEENFVMGNLTSCCAKLLSSGGGAQHAMIVHPDMQPLVVRNNKGVIIGFSIVYVNREKGYAVLNNIETHNKYNSAPENVVKEIYGKFIAGVEKFVAAYNQEFPQRPITQVNCGLSATGKPTDKYIKQNLRAKKNLEAVNFNDYKYNGSGSWSGDWFRDQYIIWADDKENLYQR